VVRIVKPLAYALLIALVLAAGLYVVWPTLLAWAVPKYVERFGVTMRVFDIGRPGLESMRIESASLRFDIYEVDFSEVALTYSWRGLFGGRFDAIDIGALTATIGESDEPTSIAVPPLWSLIPADHLLLRSLTIDNQSPVARFVGSFELDESSARGTFDVDSPQLPTSLDARVELDPTGGIEVSLAQRGGAEIPAIRVRGVPDDAGRIALTGQVNVGAETFALLAGLAGFTDATGEVHATVEGDAPWPLDEDFDWRGVRGRANLDATLADVLDGLDEDRISGHALFDFDAGGVRLSSDDLVVRAAAFDFGGARFMSEPGTMLPLSFDLLLPLPMPDADSPMQLEGSIDTDLALAFASESPAAPVSWASATGSLTASIADGQVAIGLGSGFEVEASTTTLGDITVETGDELRVQYQLGTGRIAVRDGRLIVRIPQLEIAGQRLAFRNARLELEEFDMRGDDVAAKTSVHLRSGADALPVEMTVQLNLEDRSGGFALSTAGNVAKALLKSELSGWRSDYDLDRGRVDARFNGTFRQTGDAFAIDGEGSAKLAKATLHYGETILDGVDTELPLRWHAGTLTAGPAPVRIGTVDPGVAITAVEFDAWLDADAVELTAIGANVLGGRASIPAVRYDLSDSSAAFTVTLADVQLADVLALEGEDIVGTGVLDGTLPVTIDDTGMVVTGGRIATRPPGGRLSYRGGFTGASVPGLDLAMTALRNFDYESMTADVDYGLDGTLALAVHLKGKSPDVEKGRPIHFNLNVTESVPALLESLRAAESVTERVQRRFSR